MESEIQNIPASMPLQMERSEKLKVFAVLSKHNDVPHELVKGKLVLAIVISYTPAEAVMGATAVLAQSGKNPQEYNTPYMLIGRELAGVIQVESPAVPSVEEILAAPRIQKEAEEEAGVTARADTSAATKSAADLASYVRFVFSKAGTRAQKKTAEAVIVKFQKYAKSFNAGH